MKSEIAGKYKAWEIKNCFTFSLLSLRISVAIYKFHKQTDINTSVAFKRSSESSSSAPSRNPIPYSKDLKLQDERQSQETVIIDSMGG